MNKCLLSFIFICSALFSSTVSAYEEIWIVTNSQRSDIQMSKRQIKQLFLGGVSKYPLTPLVIAAPNKGRIIFNNKVLGLSEHRLQAYWAQMKFTGRKEPPLEVTTLSDLMDELVKKDDVITFVPAGTTLPDSVKTISVIK